MNRKPSRPAIEIAAESIAAACLGGAIGFAVWTLAPLGAGSVAASVAGLVGTIAALFVMGRIDRPSRSLGDRFAPVDFSVVADVLLLEDPIETDGVLLLDDPLPAVTADSRVVQLFALPAPVGVASPLPAPGEMVARIEGFLGVARNRAAASDGAPDRVAADASAALHAALADIRRSLHQG